MNEQGFSTEHIDYLEKGFLDLLEGKIERSQMQISVPKEIRVLRIEKISRFSDPHQEKNAFLRLFMEDLVAGLYECGVPLIFNVIGDKNTVTIVMGTFADSASEADQRLQTVQTSLRAAFEGILYQDESAPAWRGRLSQFRCGGLLTGTPTRKWETGKIAEEQLERLIRGLYTERWAYLVLATPVPQSEVGALFNAVLNQTRAVFNAEKSLGGESPLSQRYKELLQISLNKLQLAKAQGLWNTAVFLLSDDVQVLNRFKAVAKSAFGGKESLPERIRVTDLQGPGAAPGLVLNKPPKGPGFFNYPYQLMSTLNSEDVTTFVHLPQQEMPGYQMVPYARFSVHAPADQTKTIAIGKILDQSREIGNSYGVSLSDLNKHGLVVGVTGSGKTNTIFALLKTLWGQKIPFLVIEPAKTEYRSLLRCPVIGKDLRVFTLGDETLSSFRVNPFEVPEFFPVQTHIDLLKSVFNASFFMWGPLPQVLERCLHEIYLDKGWDLVLSQNPRGIQRNAYPTLGDLYRKIDQVVETLEYSRETTLELRSSLKTRIDSLRIGAKGVMLDTAHSFPMATLLEKPVILELDALGDDEEKAFLMGLVLVRMHEHLATQGIVENRSLRHVTVIEEAHRLLSQATGGNQFTGNTRGKAVETFTNLLSEIRAYGEGFLIAEQIPVKLAPDVVKNTNVKILHRIVAEDDRNVMGAAMNMNEEGLQQVTSFKPGEAAVYSEADSAAFHVQIPYSKIAGPGDDPAQERAALRELIKSRAEQPPSLAPFEHCTLYCRAICRHRNLGERIALSARFSSQLPALIMALLAAPADAPVIAAELLDAGLEEGRKMNDPAGVKICSVIHGAHHYFEGLGQRYGWAFAETEGLKKQGLHFFGELSRNFSEGDALSATAPPVSAALAEFVAGYRALCQDKQPTRFCRRICADGGCLYRFLLSPSLNNPEDQKRWVEIINGDAENICAGLQALCREIASDLFVSVPDAEVFKSVALCVALQKCQASSDLSIRHVRMIMERLIESDGGWQAGH